MPDLTHDDADERIVEAQLGRTLRGNWAVARRCHLGVPMAIESHPRMPDGAPFPTLFWLTCPILVKRASRLEGAGWMSDHSDDLARRPTLRNRLVRAIARYRTRHDAHEVIDDRGSHPGGGPDRVKCLHAHVAHELADPPNPVGARVLGEVGFPDCVLPCVKP